MEAVPLIAIGGDDPRHRAMADKVMFLQSITQPMIREAADADVELSQWMTAAAFFAGGLMGQLITIGAARDQDKRTATDAMATNFRAGIAAGKRAAARALVETTEGTA